MNDRISGVNVYGGGPVQHYVFTGELQRRRRTTFLTVILSFILAALIALCIHLAYLEISQPPVATASPVATQAAAHAAPAQVPLAQDAPAAR